jgi:glycosyltransferase involved in cell wall biosynthesis
VKVSVIVAAFNASETIAETLDSLLAQTHADWEAIVVDDGSSDGTSAVVEAFARGEPRIRLMRQPNAGEAGARNTGIGAARYDWLLFLDADDWIDRRHLGLMTAALAADPGLDAVHCRYARVAADGTAVVDPYLAPEGDMFATWARRSAFPVHACVVRKSLVDAVGRFDTSFLKSTDWDLWQRVARTGARFGSVPEVLAFYRMTPNAASLDARQLLVDGLRVLRQGHGPDPRVRDPHPSHVQGEPPEGVATQAFYLLSWCAGLSLGAGRDPGPLLELVAGERFPELYPPAVAQCLFDSATLPRCESAVAWERLWPAIRGEVERYLAALEATAGAPGLAEQASLELARMALTQAPSWGDVIRHLEEVAERREEVADRREEERARWQRVAEEQTARAEVAEAARVEQGMALSERLRRASEERQALFFSPERRVGDFLLNRLKLATPLRVAMAAGRTIGQRLVVPRLAMERRLGGPTQRRMVATICWNFPIYSQTFVYQELTRLQRHGFTLRLIYSKLDPHDQLPRAFEDLWHARRRLFLNRSVHERDFRSYQRRMPDRVAELVGLLCRASNKSEQELTTQGNFLEAFSFTRMVEAYRPDYLHSYFFYDRSLMALIAGFLLRIPRGISCYADHNLTDYELKVVGLHLELADLVIATSERIKRELLAISPAADPDRILVKPNGIDTVAFPAIDRGAASPGAGAPLRLVTVSRIEPKKGLLDLVDAVALLRGRGHRVEAHLIGARDEWSAESREYQERLDRRISELDLWGTVHLEGRRSQEQVRTHLGASHLFVAPFVETEAGDKDGIPTALLEAMATGLAPVATDAGSIAEVVTHGHDGLLVPQRDPRALAEAIESLVIDGEKRARLGQAAAATVRARFDADLCERPFHERVDGLIERRRAGAANGS